MYRSGTRRAVRPLLMYSDGARAGVLLPPRHTGGPALADAWARPPTHILASVSTNLAPFNIHRQRERERERETDRQTDRQTDTHTDRQADYACACTAYRRQ
jgi:hypothetical protein